MANKHSVENYISGDTLDMSLLQLTECPPKTKMTLTKQVSIVNISNNLLVSIPSYICTFIQIREMDLSKNKLKSLPDQFGDLVNLKRLDLYDNQLSFLPLSFCKLQKLKWLDISSNPIPQALMSIAGPCQNAKECESAAQNVVKYFGVLSIQVGKEFEKAKKAEKEKTESVINHEPMTVSKRKQKNKHADRKEGGKEDAKAGKEISATPATAEVKQQKKNISVWRYLFFYTFAFIIIGFVYIWTNDLDITNIIECLKTGLNCSLHFLN